jgi:hypothetical protein
MEHPAPRQVKFRQAAFVYLHVTVLYEATALMAWREGLLHRGPPVLWLAGGLLVGVGISYALLRWQNVWLARAVWLSNAARLPTLIKQAFLAEAAGTLTRSFYLTALVVIVINMWMLARAGWDV